MTTIEIFRDERATRGAKWMTSTTRGRNRIPSLCRAGVDDDETLDEVLMAVRESNMGCDVRAGDGE